MHFISTPLPSFCSVKDISIINTSSMKQNYVAAGSLPTRLAIYLRESNKFEREQESFPLSFRFGPRLDCQVGNLWGVSLRLTHNTNTYTHSKNMDPNTKFTHCPPITRHTFQNYKKVHFVQVLKGVKCLVSQQKCISQILSFILL